MKRLLWLLIVGAAFVQGAFASKDYYAEGVPAGGTAQEIGSRYVNLATGDFYVCTSTTYANKATTCNWTKINSAGGGTWGSITGTLSSQTDLQTALNLLSPIASPTFTGVPAMPTAAVSTSTTQGATTAFVMNQLAAPGTIGGTTPGAIHGTTIDATGGITAIADGVHAQQNALGGNTTAATDITNTAAWEGPSVASFTNYKMQLPSTGPTLNQFLAFGTPSGTNVPVNFVSSWTILNVAAPASDTITCPNNTATSFATTVYTIPANTLIAGKIYRVTLGFTFLSSGSPPTMGLNLLIGGTTVYTTLPTTPTASVGSRPISLEFLIQGTAAASASAGVLTHPLPGFTISAGPTVTPFTVSTVTQPVNLATNGTLAINPQLFCSVNTAGNSVTLQQILVESN